MSGRGKGGKGLGPGGTDRGEDSDPLTFIIIIGFIFLVIGFLSRLLGRRAKRRLNPGTGEAQSKCHLFASDTKDPTLGHMKDESPNASLITVQATFQEVIGSMEDGTNFSSDTLRTMYISLLSGLVDSDSEDPQDFDIDQMVDEAMRLIDTNQDGTIDLSEMQSIQLPRQSGEFIFDDVVACSDTTSSSSLTASGETCVTADQVVDFLNVFYGGAQVVSPELAQHIRETSGPDTCYTRAEFDAAFSTPSGALSAAFSFSGPEPSFLSFAIHFGAALLVFWLASPF